MSDAAGPKDISLTARYTAAAWEKLGLPNARRFSDPVGRALLRAMAVRDAIFRRGYRPLDDLLAPRHRYIDDLLRASGARQVVEVAAGFSPRGVTFAREGIRYIEVDRESVIAEKRRLCGALAINMRFVAADVLDTAFVPHVMDHCDPKLATLVITEGLSPYFERGSYVALLHNLHRLARRLSAGLVTDFYLAPPARSMVGFELALSQGLMRIFADRFHLYAGDESEIRALFAEGGWEVLAISAPARDPRYRRSGRKLRWDPLRIVETRPA